MNIRSHELENDIVRHILQMLRLISAKRMSRSGWHGVVGWHLMSACGIVAAWRLCCHIIEMYIEAIYIEPSLQLAVVVSLLVLTDHSKVTETID